MTEVCPQVRTAHLHSTGQKVNAVTIVLLALLAPYSSSQVSGVQHVRISFLKVSLSIRRKQSTLVQETNFQTNLLEHFSFS